MTTKAKVYKDIACLELTSTDGAKWWYQGGSLAYTPVLIREISSIQYGILQGSQREILAVGLRIQGKEHLIALNLPRTDIVGLKARGLLPKHMKPPHETTNYTPWPAYTGNDPRKISLA